MKTVTVKFINRSSYDTGDKVYTYIARFDDIQVGDFAIVDVAGKYSVVQILDVQAGIGPKATKHLVQMIDDTDYKEAVVTEAKRKAILKELAEIDSKIKDKVRYAHLASVDPKAAELLNQLAGFFME
jgi:hypothetical protein